MGEAYAKGADLSHWQTDAKFSDVIVWADFVGSKACTDTFADPEFNDADDHRWRTLGDRIALGKHVCRVAYCYQTGGNGTHSADALLALMGTDHEAESLAAMDFEDESAHYDDLLAAVKRLQEKRGRKALIYGGYKVRVLSSTQRSELAKHADLWLADWSAPYTTIDPWPEWTFLQYVGIGLDLDEFHGTRAQLATYLGTTPSPKPPPEEDMGLDPGTIDMLNGEKSALNDWFNWDGGKNPEFKGKNRPKDDEPLGQNAYDTKWADLQVLDPKPVK